MENHDNHQLFGYWYPISRHTIRSGCFFAHVIGIAVTSDRFDLWPKEASALC